MEQLSPTDALREAISRVGSQSAMGRLVGVTQAAVWGWLKLNKPLPAEHV
ncbi:YdaS family helix-turn-helix protein, partial [Pseudomonas sp. RA_35y_Pfl2_P32]